MGFWQHMVYAGRRALRTRERHLESILETIPDAMIVIDGYGIMQWMRLSEECSLRSKSMIDDGFAGRIPIRRAWGLV